MVKEGMKETDWITQSQDLIERVGRAADKADNFARAALLRVNPQIHVEALAGGMHDIREELRAIYREATGEDPWAGQ